MSTPAAKGFLMPAEWQAHERCWMAWPCRQETWGDRLGDARAAYAEVAQAISEFEPVTMIANAADVATASMKCGRGVDVLPMEIDDSWMRDTGPTFLLDGAGGIAACDWRFNAWGQKYDYYSNDAKLAGNLLTHLGIERFEAPAVLEGGAIHSDGEGTILTTETVMLNPNRNPGMDKAAAEQLLADWLGAKKVIWLPAGLHMDETDGHVDNIVCFVRPGVVVAASCPDEDDPNFEILGNNIELLRSSTDARGRTLEVVTVDQPARMEEDGQRLSSSYINFYIANGGIVMPSFEDRRDGAARRTIAQLFPHRRVVQVPAVDIVCGGGGIHCITQQQPRVSGR